LEEQDKEVMVCLIENIDTIILNYSNDHAVKVYAPKLLSKENGGGSTPGSNGSLQLPKSYNNSEFSTAVSTKNSKEEKKGHSSKKLLSTPL